MRETIALNFGVAFAQDNREWAGGVRYFQNLFHALQNADAQNSLNIHVLYAQGLPRAHFIETFPSVKSFHEIPMSSAAQLLARPTLRRMLRPLLKKIPCESPNSRLARRLRLDVVLAFNDFDLQYRVPVLYWLPDVQHVKLPDNFSPEEVRDRDELFRLAADNARTVVFSSRDSADVFSRWHPTHRCRISVQPFTAQLSPDVFDGDPAWVCAKYHLPQKFLFLPNQFWKHKNHALVVSALHLLKDKEPDLRVVCTGNVNDYRHPEHYSDLIRLVSELGLRERIIFLGAVPRADLDALMRQSVAVIQPSLFEGWSTTVEEVKSLGKRIILSDIPVHREQDPPGAAYFDPSSAQALAGCLADAFGSTAPGPDLALERQARAAYADRVKRFGISYLDMLRATAGP